MPRRTIVDPHWEPVAEVVEGAATSCRGVSNDESRLEYSEPVGRMTPGR